MGLTGLHSLNKTALSNSITKIKDVHLNPTKKNNSCLSVKNMQLMIRRFLTEKKYPGENWRRCCQSR
jgi:hypothetical protein